MPALPAIENVARVSIQGTLGGVAYANVFHHKWTTAAQNTAQMNALALGYRNAFKTAILPKLGSQFTLGSTLVQDLTTSLGPQGIATGSDVGTAGTAVYPNNVSMCISWKIDRRYRGGKPRTYLGGFLNGNDSDSRHWSGGFITIMTTALTTFYNAINAISGLTLGVNGPGVVHYYRDKHLLTTPDFDNFTGFSINNRMDSQRRRLGR